MTDETQQSSNQADVRQLLDALKDEFRQEQTTPLNDKKLTIPVALATVIIGSLVVATWKVSSFYESAINDRIQAGIRERDDLRKELKKITSQLTTTKDELEKISDLVEDNQRELKFINRSNGN